MQALSPLIGPLYGSVREKKSNCLVRSGRAGVGLPLPGLLVINQASHAAESQPAAPDSPEPGLARRLRHTAPRRYCDFPCWRRGRRHYLKMMAGVCNQSFSAVRVYTECGDNHTREHGKVIPVTQDIDGVWTKS